jgi:aryl-alcohol dehydrogenase-like predicted oxidoreductase
MERRKLGNSGLEVSAIGLGCMGMSAYYGETDEAESTAAIRRALELGVNFLDTAEIYGPYTNEELIGRAVGDRRDEFVVATKFGVHVDPGDPGNAAKRGIDGTPENVRRSIEASLRRLGMDHVELYYQHRIDPRVPIEETIGALAELVNEGKVRAIGLSEASPETIRRAHNVHPIAAVQTEYSLWTRDVEDEVLPVLRELGITLVAYSPLGRGFLSGRFTSPDELDADDWRLSQPRFSAEAMERNRDLSEAVASIADSKDAMPAQVALAWVLAQGDDIVPIPGTKRRTYLEQNATAVDLELTEDDLATLAELPEPEGERYDPAGMSALNV